MHSYTTFVLSLSLGVRLVHSLRYDAQYLDYNLNQNDTAVNPLDYNGRWENHSYTPSPTNWRFPFYTLFLDRYVNGDPSNDNANGTAFEQDIRSTQLRHGGDLQGLLDSLDYIHGMGIKVGEALCDVLFHVDMCREYTSPDHRSSTNHGSRIPIRYVLYPRTKPRALRLFHFDRILTLC